ncbi:MAG: ABC transporter ATP-binding protein [Desulfopila sp.]
MIEIDRLSFAYADGRQIFTDFSLAIRRGEAVTIIGPSGCGKTTLLSLVAGLLRPHGGAIRVAGQVITRARPRTGLVLQDHGLLPWATVRQNTELGLTIRKYYGPDGHHSPVDMETDSARLTRRIEYWLDWLGIREVENRYPVELSRGQRQRAAIARTLVLDPDLLLMDEPFSALDAPIREELQKVMSTFHQESGLTSITVTHDIEEAVVLGQKILVLGNGVNREPVLIDNHLRGASEKRNDPEFVRQCQELKRTIGGQTIGVAI